MNNKKQWVKPGYNCLERNQISSGVIFVNGPETKGFTFYPGDPFSAGPLDTMLCGITYAATVTSNGGTALDLCGANVQFNFDPTNFNICTVCS